MHWLCALLASILFSTVLGIDTKSSSYVGCYIDSEERQLPKKLVSHLNTPEFCMGVCHGQGFPLAGVQTGTECFCGEKLKDGTKVNDNDCSAACPGDDTIKCGGAWRLSVYRSGVTGKKINPVNSSYLGCYPDDSNRLLNGALIRTGTLTPEHCVNLCKGRGYRLAGAEAGGECFCGDNIPSTVQPLPEAECGNRCGGDDSLICGGPWRLSTYRTEVSRKGVNSVISNYVGCYIDDSSRQLNGHLIKDPAVTPDFCVSHCFKKGFSLAGIQVGSECFCGDSLKEGTKVIDSECNVPCIGDDLLMCGGRWRLSVYRTLTAGNGFNPVYTSYLGCYKDTKKREVYGVVKLSKSLTPDYCRFRVQCFCGDLLKESTKVPESECTISCPGDRALKCGDSLRMNIYKTNIDYQPSSYYIGCFEENHEDGFFNGISINSESLTTDFCVGFCYRRGYSFAATEYGEGCFCGNSLGQKDKVELNECNIPCVGDRTQLCGGHRRLSVYKTGLPTSNDIMVPYNSLPTYVGCFVDNGDRQIDTARTDSAVLTPDLCTSFCYRKGFRLAGLQVGVQCFCGDSLKEGSVVEDKKCNVTCSGDDSLKCGGPWHLSVYRTQIPDDNVKSHFVGCYDGNNNNKVLVDISKQFKYMTVDYCLGFCYRRGFIYAGMQNGDSCYCGNKLKHNNMIGNSKCEKPCAGDKKQYCGGNWRFSVYQTGLHDINKIDKSLCKKSESYVNGNVACKGQILFEENFSYGLVDELIWAYSKLMPSVPDNEFIVLGDRAKNIFVKNGILHIRPTLSTNNLMNGNLNIKDCTGQSTVECSRQAMFFYILPPVESARINTKNTFSFRYGKVEIRAKLPLGDWIVPELWLIPKDNYYGPYYSSGKIRVAMARGNEELKSDTADLSNTLLEAGVLMGADNDIQLKLVNWTKTEGWYSKFHNYTFLWTPDNLSFSVDDSPAVPLINGNRGRLSELINFKTRSVESWNKGTNIAPFDKEFYISLGLSVGGVRDFPDHCLNRKKQKPWTDSDAKALLNFWMDRDDWYSTWKKDLVDLQVDYVKVTAL